MAERTAANRDDPIGADHSPDVLRARRGPQENGQIAVTCEFCSTTYHYSVAELQSE